jgi:hypothetical protein
MWGLLRQIAASAPQANAGWVERGGLMCDHAHEQPCEPGPEDDDPLRKWKAHPVKKKEHKEMEFIQDTMR